LQKVWLLRRMVAMISNDSNNLIEATEKVMERLKKSKSNAEFLINLAKSAE